MVWCRWFTQKWLDGHAWMDGRDGSRERGSDARTVLDVWWEVFTGASNGAQVKAKMTELNVPGTFTNFVKDRMKGIYLVALGTEEKIEEYLVGFHLCATNVLDDLRHV